LANHKPRPFYHMLPEDTAIWERFLAKFEDQFQLYEYDVLVGPRVDLSEVELEPELQQLAERLLAIRIDVVASRPGEKWVIEVKPTAGLSALGQILGYEFYYSRLVTPGTFLGKMVVTDYLRHYMGPLFDYFGVWVLVLPEEKERPAQLIPPSGVEYPQRPVKLEV
jgi:hypothetical protein